jgi:hypothetical protein
MRTSGQARRRYVFTPALTEALRDAYRAPNKRVLSARLRKLRGLKPGWPPWTWKCEAKRLGIVTHDHWRAWTKAEDRALLEMAGRLSCRRMAVQLGRSVESVQARAAALELLSRVREGFTAADLARCFGVTEYKAGQWLAAGLFGRAERADGNARATEANVRAFLREHPQKYDLRRVDQVWFLSMAFGSVGRDMLARDLNTGDELCL